MQIQVLTLAHLKVLQGSVSNRHRRGHDLHHHQNQPPHLLNVFSPKESELLHSVK